MSDKMDFATYSLGEYYPNYKIPLWLNPEESFTNPDGVDERFRLILVKEGTGVLRLGERRIIFMAPALFCFNTTDCPVLERETGLAAVGFYFHPAIINDSFTFDNIKNPESMASMSDLQSCYWLHPFFFRNDHYFGYLNLNLAFAKKIECSFQCVREELTSQRDGYWPCRSRSYFIELLILVNQIYETWNGEIFVLGDFPSELDDLLLYLHTNYSRKITIDELCHEFGLNRTTLSERFTRITGVSIVAYLNKLRIRISAAILRDTRLPISEVAERVGFGDLTHFGRTFRKLTGISPSDYREQNCWMKS